MKTYTENGKPTPIKRFLILSAVTTLLLPSLFLAGFYFAFYFKNSCHEFEERVEKIEKYQELSQSILLEITRSIKTKYSHLSHNGSDVKHRREKRAISLVKSDDKIDYRFRKEMITLNERYLFLLLLLLSYELENILSVFNLSRHNLFGVIRFVSTIYW